MKQQYVYSLSVVFLGLFMGISATQAAFVYHSVRLPFDSTGSAPYVTLKVCDANNDGHDDFFIGRENQLLLEAGQGNNQFNEEQVFTTEDSLDRVLLYDDLDGDGYPDILYQTGSGDTASFVFNYIPGGGGSEHVLSDTHIDFAASIDMDGDTLRDLAVAQEGGSQVVLLHNDGGMQFSPMDTIDVSGIHIGTVSCIAVGDMDGEGYEDVVVATANTNSLLWYGGMQHGRLEPHTVAEQIDDPVNKMLLLSLATADTLSIVTSSSPRPNGMHGTGVTVWYWTYPSNRYVRESIGTEVTDFQLIDWDNDGDLDLVAFVPWRLHANPVEYALVMYINNFHRGIGVENFFGWDPYLPPFYNIGRLSDLSGHFSGNELPDLLTLTPVDTTSGVHSVPVVMNPAPTIMDFRLTFLARGVLPLSYVPTDLNGDGYLDVPFTLESDSMLVILRPGQWESLFEETIHLLLANGIGQMDTADMDGDGDEDIVSLLYNDERQNCSGWVENQGNMNFATHPTDNLPLTPGAPFQAVADVDEDGDPDIVTVNSSGELIYLLNDGTGQLTTQPAHDSFVARRIFACEDVTQDGHPDVIGMDDQGKVFIYPSDFANPSSTPFTPFDQEVSALSVADMNGDGFMDLAVSGETVQIYEQATDGSHTFTPILQHQEHLLGSNRAVKILPIDLDRDGDMDLLAPLRECSGYYENDGGSFVAHTLSNIPLYKYKAGDMDNDGMPDLVGASSFVGHPQFWSNTFTAPSAVPGDGLSLPSAFRITRLYPNPFNGMMTVHYNLPRSSTVRISLFNLLGQRVMALPERSRTAGSHTAALNLEGLASGVYVVRVDAGKLGVVEQKATLMK